MAPSVILELYRDAAHTVVTGSNRCVDDREAQLAFREPRTTCCCGGCLLLNSILRGTKHITSGEDDDSETADSLWETPASIAEFFSSKALLKSITIFIVTGSITLPIIVLNPTFSTVEVEDHQRPDDGFQPTIEFLAQSSPVVLTIGTPTQPTPEPRNPAPPVGFAVAQPPTVPTNPPPERARPAAPMQLQVRKP